MLDHRTRIRSLQRDRWIDYPRATEAIRRLERLLNAPQRERMPCLAMHGDSNIGKTLIVSKLRREHPSTFNDLKGVECRQIIAMQMPATPDQHRFYAALLFELGAPHSMTASHHLLAGGHREQRASLNLLKYLANDLKFSVVVVGTSDALLALETDAQMRSRFTPFEIPRWRECDEFRRLLSAFERVLPLRKASNLAQKAVVEFLLAASGGLTGEVSRLLNEAAELAIVDATERITMQHLEHVGQVAV